MAKTVVVEGTNATAIIKKRRKSDPQPTVVIKYRGVSPKRKKKASR